MLEDWITDLTSGTATHVPTGLVIELVKDHPIWPLLLARRDTTTGLVLWQVEKLTREGTIAFREAWTKRAG